MTKICAVIVTWRPNIELLRRVLEGVGPQVDELVVIDNTPENPLPGNVLVAGNTPLLIERPESNLGLAGGQNRGVGWAVANGFSHVLFLDQDSIPDKAMVATLIETESRLLAQRKKVGVIGPICGDKRTGIALPFCKIRSLRVVKIYGPQDCGDMDWCEPEFLISSGSLIRVCVLNEVGVMDERLFIDSVDIEWCYRAASKGYSCIGVFAAHLDHELGDGVILLLGGRLRLFRHNPARLYSIMRNRVYLYSLRHVPVRWKLLDIPRLATKLLLFSFFVKPRWNNFTHMLKGIVAGVRFSGR